MSDKYYTPDIQDIRVGYECEIESNSKWTSHTINAIDAEENSVGTYEGVHYWLSANSIRTPYLTREQIEREGWEFQKRGVDYWFKFKEHPITHTKIQEYYGYKPYSLYCNYGTHDQKLKIKCDFTGGLDFGESDTLFEGKCKSINEFRTILKLLGI